MAIAIRDFDFQGNQIRCVGTDRDPWFVAKDVVEALGMVWKGKDSLGCLPPDWISLRKLRTHVRQRDGTLRVMEIETHCINEAGLYKLAFRSNKPSADAFTNWVSSEVLPSIRKTGQYVSNRRANYEKKGKQLEWIEQREEGIEVRKGFTDTLKDHGVEGRGYANCTNEVYRPILGGSAELVKANRSLPQKSNLRDSLSTLELAKVKLAEMFAADRIAQDNLQGNAPCARACGLTASAVAEAARRSSEGELT